MAKIKYIGTYPMEVLKNPGDVVGVHVQPGEEVDVPDERVDDFLRRTEYFSKVVAAQPAAPEPAVRAPRHRAGEEG